MLKKLSYRVKGASSKKPVVSRVYIRDLGNIGDYANIAKRYSRGKVGYAAAAFGSFAGSYKKGWKQALAKSSAKTVGLMLKDRYSKKFDYKLSKLTKVATIMWRINNYE